MKQLPSLPSFERQLKSFDFTKCLRGSAFYANQHIFYYFICVSNGCLVKLSPPWRPLASSFSALFTGLCLLILWCLYWKQTNKWNEITPTAVNITDWFRQTYGSPHKHANAFSSLCLFVLIDHSRLRFSCSGIYTAKYSCCGGKAECQQLFMKRCE